MALNLTVERLEEMGESVILRSTYGNIAIEHWVADDIVTGWDLKREREKMDFDARMRLTMFKEAVNAEIERRVEAFKVSLTEARKADDWRAEELFAWRNEAEKWSRIRQEFFKTTAAKLKKEMLVTKRILQELPELERRRLFAEAVEREVIESYDESMVKHAHLFPDILGPILKEWSKKTKDGERK